MAETTTIQITKEQAEQLDKRKQYDGESYKSVIARLLDDNNSAITDGAIEELKNEISMASDPAVEVDTEAILNRLDDLETRLPAKVAKEVRR